MTLTDFLKDIWDSSKERLKNPIISTFAIAWIVINWKPLFYLINSGKINIHERLNDLTYCFNNPWNLYVYPILAVVFYNTLLPFISNLFEYLTNKILQTRKIRAITNRENETIAKQGLVREEAELKLIEANAKEVKDLKNQNESYVKEIKELKSSLNKKQKEVDNLDNLTIKNNSLEKKLNTLEIENKQLYGIRNEFLNSKITLDKNVKYTKSIQELIEQSIKELKRGDLKDLLEDVITRHNDDTDQDLLKYKNDDPEIEDLKKLATLGFIDDFEDQLRKDGVVYISLTNLTNYYIQNSTNNIETA